MHRAQLFSWNTMVVFSLVFARSSGLAWLAPPFRSPAVPGTARAGLAAVLALLLTPAQLAAAIDVPGTWIDYLPLLAGELAVGALLGLGAWVLLSACRSAGEMIAQQSGLGLFQSFAPEADSEAPLLGGFYGALAMTLFLVIGGHRMLLAALLESLESLPLGRGGLSDLAAPALLALLSKSCTLTLRIAAPVVVTLLLVGVTRAWLERSLPQIQSLAGELSIRALVGLLMIALSLGGLALVLNGEVATFSGSFLAFAVR